MSKWISVKDQLPNEGAYFVIDKMYAKNNGGRHIDIAFCWGGEWISEYLNEELITHWMELPEPPEKFNP